MIHKLPRYTGASSKSFKWNFFLFSLIWWLPNCIFSYFINDRIKSANVYMISNAFGWFFFFIYFILEQLIPIFIIRSKILEKFFKIHEKNFSFCKTAINTQIKFMQPNVSGNLRKFSMRINRIPFVKINKILVEHNDCFFICFLFLLRTFRSWWT